MKNKTEEEYVFLRTCSSDFDMALKSLTMVDEHEFGYLQFVLLRDAVISYGRPFSRNQGIHKASHRLTIEDVPKEHSLLHLEILRLRDTLFAHSDISEKNPKLGLLGGSEEQRFVISHKGNYLSDIKASLENMSTLIVCVQENIREQQLVLEEILQHKPHELSGQ